MSNPQNPQSPSEIACTKAQWRRLKETIARYADQYHRLDQPGVSDDRYDAWVRTLEAIEAQHPHWPTEERSPTQQVGGELLDHFQKKAHLCPMLSLDNVFEGEALREGVKRMVRGLSGASVAFCCEFKVDGLAVALRYEGGFLKEALTRGNGQMGESIKRQIEMVAAIPKRLQASSLPDRFEVRGELFMSKKAFENLNHRLLAEGAAPFAHPRNAAAGSVRQLNLNLIAERELDFAAHQLILDDASSMSEDRRQSTDLHQLKAWGFQVHPWTLAQDIEAIEAFYHQVEANRSSLDFGVDGIVMKLDALSQQRALGASARSPRWALAYKFPPKEAITRLQKVDFQVGRSGIVTPRAVMDRVWIEGAWIGSATLHHEGIVEALGLHEQDWVVVRRSGDVIPQIVSVVEAMRKPGALPISFPEFCPSCGGPLKVHEGRCGRFCSQKLRCPAIREAALASAVSREVLNLEGLGPKRLSQMLKVDPELDLQRLMRWGEEDFQRLPGVQRRGAFKLAQAIEKGRHAPLSLVIFALNIEGVGRETAQSLATHFGSWKSLLQAKFKDFLEIDGLGPKGAAALDLFFENERQKTKHPVLPAPFFCMETEAETVASPGSPSPISESPWLGVTVTVTGSFEGVTRRQLEEKLAKAGGRLRSQWSQESRFLWVGSKPSPAKLRKAEACKTVMIWGEQEVLDWWHDLPKKLGS